MDTVYINGVIAVKESALLGEKLLRLAEATAEEAMRALSEAGFGGGAPEETEPLCRAEEESLCAFIREYAPSAAIKTYLLAPQDFHNAKALCKAELTGADAAPMLSPEGELPVSRLASAIRGREYEALGSALGEAARAAMEEPSDGAKIGALFDRALYGRLVSACRREKLLKVLLSGKADRTNLLTAMRSKSAAGAREMYVEGGSLTEEALDRVFEAGAENAFENTACAQFYRLLQEAKEKGLPFTEAERALESYEAEYFAKRRFDLAGKEPFLYYVFRRCAEIQNVRILLVLLNAGLSPQEIRRRLRAV